MISLLKRGGIVMEEDGIVQKKILPVMPISVLYFQMERFIRVDSSVRARGMLKGGDEVFFHFAE
jgi:hypothetical protein